MRRVSCFALVPIGMLLGAPHAAADQSLATGTGPLTASARIDFKIVIPHTLAFRLTSGAATGGAVALPAGLTSALVPNARNGIPVNVSLTGVDGRVATLRLQGNARQLSVGTERRDQWVYTVAAP
jgi:hypothetical protein